MHPCNNIDYRPGIITIDMDDFSLTHIPLIDGTTYLALYVGPMVQMNMQAIGHATLVFTDEVPKKPMTNAIYLEKDSKEKMPEFKVGDWITYEHR